MLTFCLIVNALIESVGSCAVKHVLSIFDLLHWLLGCPGDCIWRKQFKTAARYLDHSAHSTKSSRVRQKCVKPLSQYAEGLQNVAVYPAREALRPTCHPFWHHLSCYCESRVPRVPATQMALVVYTGRCNDTACAGESISRPAGIVVQFTCSAYLHKQLCGSS